MMLVYDVCYLFYKLYYADHGSSAMALSST